jgi:histidinol phosphatase-like enzyme
MIENLIKKWPVDRKKSFMIGDQKTDEIAANKSSLYFRYTENEFDKLVIKICKKRNI